MSLRTQPNILIALPTYNHAVHIDFALALARTLRALNDAGVRYETIHAASSHIIRARNFFANYFLSHDEFTHLLFLDTDMDFSREAPLRLIAGDKPVAGVAYPHRQFDHGRVITQADVGLSLRDWLEKNVDYTAALQTNEAGDGFVKDGWAEVRHVGTGLLLIRRDAFEAVVPLTQLYRAPSQYASLLTDGRFYGFFDTVADEGVYLSEDLSFCQRVRAAGLPVWALIDETVVHHGSSAISGQYLRALQMRGHVGG
ncbi:glycosyltransferase family 2 protein [Paraburkholderia adhaesiva]|uniref:glycosyltransferase family 2 protein n=1 Tax=Paraburkholderia adhaesiva TaxID=2883244 RepID=UPI001F2439AF|nr:hypothetical protein [Paraburkholderia adhaesiva]